MVSWAQIPGEVPLFRHPSPAPTASTALFRGLRRARAPPAAPPSKGSGVSASLVPVEVSPRALVSPGLVASGGGAWSLLSCSLFCSGPACGRKRRKDQFLPPPASSILKGPDQGLQRAIGDASVGGLQWSYFSLAGWVPPGYTWGERTHDDDEAAGCCMVRRARREGSSRPVDRPLFCWLLGLLFEQEVAVHESPQSK